MILRPIWGLGGYVPRCPLSITHLFFECHFEFYGLDFGWGSSPGMATVDECLAAMFQLRAKGIRAHFWISFAVLVLDLERAQ